MQLFNKKPSYTLWFWIISLATTILRLLVIGRIGLSGDEAHYWTYTRYLSLSYFDHPPLVAYVIKLSSLVFGNTEFAVRFPTVMFFLAVCILVFKLAKDLFDERTAFWTIVLLNVTPVFSFLGAVMTIPDAPLSIFWVGFIYLFWEKIIKNGNASWWYVLGILFGFGLLSKYNAVLLIPSAALFLLLSARHRSWLSRKEPYLAVLIGFALFLPVIIWNLQNDLASFGFQMHHGFGKKAPEFSLTTFTRCMGAQAGYISPLLFFLYWIVLFILAKQSLKDRDEKALLLFSFSFPTLFLFNSIACFNEILPHWPAMGYFILTIAVTRFTLQWWHKKAFRGFSYAAWGLGILLTVLVPLQAMFKVLQPEFFLPKAEASKIEDGITKAEKVDVTNELYGWHEVGARLTEILKNSPEPKPFIFTHRHYIASQLSFYVPGHPRIYCLSDRADAYDFWQRDLKDLNGRDALFVTNDYFYTDPRKAFPFTSWDASETLDTFRGSRKVHVFWITRGRKFDLQALKTPYTSGYVGSTTTVKQSLTTIDNLLFAKVNRDWHNGFVDAIMWKVTKFDTDFAINSQLLVLVALIGVVLWRTRREKFWPEFILAIGIIGVGGIIVHLMKDYFDRLRPLAVLGKQVLVFHEHFEHGSFPSGHTQIAFSVATYLTVKLKRFGWLFFALAALMGLSRIYVGMHFPSDVMAGALIGILVAIGMIKIFKID